MQIFIGGERYDGGNAGLHKEFEDGSLSTRLTRARIAHDEEAFVKPNKD